MKSYVLELPAGDATDLATAGELMRMAAEQLTHEGIPVRWVRSVYAPEHETCLLVFEARTPGAPHARIVEGEPT